MEVRDPLFTFDFIIKHLGSNNDGFQHQYSEKKLKNLGWLVHADGEHKSEAFAILKPQINAQFSMKEIPTKAAIQQMIQDFDWA
jgi:hypothetical protein